MEGGLSLSNGTVGLEKAGKLLRATIKQISKDAAKDIGSSHANRKKFLQETFGWWSQGAEAYLQALLVKKLYSKR